jgi:hypothetical protein
MDGLSPHRDHAWSVDEELLHVPLWIRAPGVAPRRDDTPVSLLDIGPTILDAGENRRKQTIVFPDRIKVICDRYRGTLEVYDLTADPGELHNLVSGDTAPYEARIRQCWDFFDAIRLRRPGYETPYIY